MTRRAAVAGVLALAVAVGAGGAITLGVGGMAPESTLAAWTSDEAGGLEASAGTVAAPAATCEGHNSAPNLLRPAPGDGGLEVTGYRVTITMGDGSDGGAEVDGPPDGWQTGEASPGVPFIPVDTPTDVPVGTTAVAWGIHGGYGYTWKGSISVTALGPGGWESPPLHYDWSVGFDLLGIGYGSCTAA